MNISKSHDRLIRETLEDHDRTVEFLKQALPPKITELLQWESLTREEGTFIDEKLKEFQTDILFSIQTRYSWTINIYILFEHKSHPDRNILNQLLRYLALIYSRNMGAPVIPLVFYHGREVWNIPVNFTHALGLPVELRELLREYLPDFSYALYNLKDQDINQMIASLSLKAILYIMKNIWNMSNESEIEQLFVTFRDLFQDSSGIKIIEKLLIYLYSNSEIEPETVKSVISRVISPDEGDIAMTTAERLMQQGMQQGMEQGMKQGMKQGIRTKAIETARALLAEKMDINKIVKITGLSLKEVEDIKRSH